MRKFITLLCLMIGFITTTFAEPSRAHPKWRTTISAEQNLFVSIDCVNTFDEQTAFTTKQMFYQSNITTLDIKAIKVDYIALKDELSNNDARNLFCPFDYGPKNYKPIQIQSSNSTKKLTETLTISCGGLPRIQSC